jgi:hypothetical protein
LVAEGVAVDLSLIAFIGKTLNVLAHFGLAVGRTAKQVLEFDLNEPVGPVFLEEQAPVGV